MPLLVIPSDIPLCQRVESHDMGTQPHVIPSYTPLSILSHGWVVIYDFLFTISAVWFVGEGGFNSCGKVQCLACKFHPIIYNLILLFL